MARTTSDLVQMFTDCPASDISKESTEFAQTAIWELSPKQSNWLFNVARRDGTFTPTSNGETASGLTADGVPFRAVRRSKADAATLQLFISCPLTLREEWIADPAAC